ncbi:hypothetical protein TeGR_g3807 [Tetraparma gracilis]|uniref:C3H1-type domain-containing protein n=1 Tax=Tetraparma gracilis TaxID=2962635 RepID=A0ABQ6MBR0_9STRA|nr:hypothetical protein TeGR_g3807 [Tetraparma gracilis]
MTEICRAFRNTGRCRFGDACSFEHSEGEPIEAPPRGQCHDFAENGTCDYGTRCKFLHGDEDGSRFEKKPRQPREPRAPRAEGDEAPKKARKPKARRPAAKLDEVCNNYLAGKCRNGDGCRRLHEPEGVEQVVEKIDEVCEMYKVGRCRFGDLCRRVHEETEQ